MTSSSRREISRRLARCRLGRAARAVGLGLAGFAHLAAAVLPHAPLVPTKQELARLARVRALLNTSTPARPNAVHIVFYGQSITIGPWWQEVADELRRLYPHASLRIENRAISGFQDWALARTVVADLIPLQPDLVIFHAYGTDNGTDSFLAQLGAGTVSEVLVQTDHPHLNNALTEATDPAKIMPDDVISYRNYVRLPQDTDRRGACLARVRDAWKDYCRSNGVTPLSLLADGIHPNADGNHLMAEFVLAYLRPGPPSVDPDDHSKVRSARLGEDIHWRNGIVECDFTGSTVMAELPGPLNGQVEVWIDGQRASANPALYGFNRVSPTHFSEWPALSQVGRGPTLLEETWTFTPFNVTDGGMNFAFRVHGSLTGPDGEGTNTARFVSNSGRVIIERGDHWIPLAVHFSGKKPLPAGFQATWGVERHFVDPLPQGLVPTSDLRQRLRLVQGLPDGPHRLRLIQRGALRPNLTVLRAYSPAGRAAIRDASTAEPIDERLHVVELETGPALRWPAALVGWSLEASQALGEATTWQSLLTRNFETDGDHLQYRLPTDFTAQFFRLRGPLAANVQLPEINGSPLSLSGGIDSEESSPKRPAQP